MGQLDGLDEGEKWVLTAIIALAQHLTRPLTYYTEALGEIRRTKLKIAGRTRPSKTKGVIDGHDVRVTERWQ